MRKKNEREGWERRMRETDGIEGWGRRMREEDERDGWLGMVRMNNFKEIGERKRQERRERVKEDEILKMRDREVDFLSPVFRLPCLELQFLLA